MDFSTSAPDFSYRSHKDNLCAITQTYWQESDCVCISELFLCVCACVGSFFLILNLPGQGTIQSDLSDFQLQRGIFFNIHRGSTQFVREDQTPNLLPQDLKLFFFNTFNSIAHFIPILIQKHAKNQHCNEPGRFVSQADVRFSDLLSTPALS